MLSSPLPAWYLAPTSLPSFLQYIVQKASEAPSNGTLEPVYTVLTNGDLRMLDSIAPKIIIGLQEHLKTILHEFEDLSTSVLCLAIFAKFTTISAPLKDRLSPDDEHDSSAASDLANRPDKFRIAKRYFTKRTSSNVFKAIDLVFLYAVQACKSTQDSSKSVEQLKVSAAILNSIEFEERRAWVQKNAPKLRNLYGKILGQHMNRNVQIAAFSAIAPLVTSGVPQELISTCERVFQGPSAPRGFYFDSILASFACHFSSSFIQQKLLDMIQLANQQCRYSMEVANEIRHARAFTRAISKTLRTSPNLRQNILVALTSNDLRGALHDFMGPINPGNIPVHVEQPGCPNAIEEEKRSFQFELSALFLRAAVHALPDEIRIDSSLAEALLSKIEQPSFIIPKCKSFRPRQMRMTEFLSMYQVGSTPLEAPVGHEWRNELENGLKRKAAQEYESILQTVNSVCQDFEKRCTEVEKPLREEEAKTKEIQSRLENLELHCKNLENETRERVLILDGLEAEKSQLLDQLDSFKQQKNQITQKYTQLQQKYDTTMTSMVNTAQESLEAAKQQELRLQASLVARDEELEQLQHLLSLSESETNYLKEQICKLSNDLDQRKSEILKAEARADRHRADLTELQEKYQEQQLINQDVVKNRDIEIAQAKEDAHHRQAEMTRLFQANIDQKETILDLQRHNVDLQREFDDRVAINDQAFMKQTAHHEQIVAELQAELESARADAQGRETEMQRTINDLGAKCERRTKEAAQAQARNKKAMALLKSTPKQQEEIEATCKRTSASDGQGSSESSPSSRNRHTPKRPKPRCSSKFQNVQQPKVAVGGKSSKPFNDPVPRLKRPQPLKELPPMTQSNISPVSNNRSFGGKVSLSDENEHLSFNGIDGLSFDGSDIYTSTDQRVDKLHDTAKQDNHDETTTDFE